MKRVIFIIGSVVVIFLSACTSGDKTKKVDSKSENEAGVENVNGNIPDTTNAINLDTHKKDSVGRGKDSAK